MRIPHYAEVLEDRSLLAVTAALVGDVLTVSLDAPNDAAFLRVDALGNIDVGTTEGGDDKGEYENVLTIIVQDTSSSGALNQSVTFSLGNAAFSQDVTATNIETINLNQDITGTISGFNVGTVNVDDPGQIQDGIDFAAAGATVNVAAGTYAENIAIDKNVSLLSANGRASTTIQGISGEGRLGAVQITNNTTGVTIGDLGQGFTIIGIDNGAPGLENAAVYFQGSHSGATIRDNEIVANGDYGLLTEFGATISGFVIDNNEFSGQTFLGSNPAGDGFSAQFTLPNVPRQLVFMGNGGGDLATALATDITFTNNQITGTAGGISTTDNTGATVAAHEQGNTLVTLDVADSTISGNTFAGTTTRFGSALRVRRPDADILNNVFDSTNMGLGTLHLFVQNNTTPLQDIVAANDFDRGSYVDDGSELSVSISGGVARALSGDILHVLTGTYNDDLDATGKALTIAIGAGVGQVAVNNLTLNGDDTLEIEVNGFITPGTDFDQIVVDGTVNLGGATLVTSGTVSGLSAGDDVVLIDNLGTDAVIGTFDGLANGAVVRINGETFRIFYNGGDGNDVVLVAGFQIIVTAPGPGTDGIVRVFDAFNQDQLFTIEPFPGFQGGVRVAVGDVNGDGTPDIITAAGPGGGPHVKVFDGTDGTTLLMNFFAFNPAFRGGVFVASGDVNGDDRADIIIGADAGGGPHVKVFSGESGAELFSFFAFNASFAGGVRVAAGDISGDDTPDIITAAGPGGGPHVRVFHGTTGMQIAGPLGNFFAYSPAFRGGVFVAAGDVNGDTRTDLITGAGGSPHVRVFDSATGAQMAGAIGNFFAYNPAFTGGVRVAASDVNGDGMADVVTTPGPGGGPHLRVFDAASTTGPVVIRDTFVEDPNFTGGIFVAAEVDQLFADGDLLTALLG